MKKIIFNKYKSSSPGYHWQQVSSHPTRRSAYVIARYKKTTQLLKKNMGTIKGKKILDIGCGDGVLSWLLAKEGAIVTGIDSSAEALSYAHKKTKKYNIEYIKRDVLKNNLNDESFDGIVCSEVIEHVADTEQFLRQLKRVLKPSGIAIISTPIKLTKTPLDRMHYFEWFVEEFQEVLEQHFSSVKVEFSHPIFWQEFFLHNLITRVLINITSLAYNPFMQNKGWRTFSLQYGIIKKK